MFNKKRKKALFRTSITVLFIGVQAVSGFSISADSTGMVFQSEEHSFRVSEVARGLKQPWGMAFLPDGTVLITERPGGFVHIESGRKTRVAGMPEVFPVGQCGLLDITLPP